MDRRPISHASRFEVPEGWEERDLLLHFGAVDYQTTLWVNGVEVGHNRGGHVPFSFETDAAAAIYFRLKGLFTLRETRGGMRAGASRKDARDAG